MLPRNATLQKLDLGVGAQRLREAQSLQPGLRTSKAGTPSATAVQSASYWLQAEGGPRRSAVAMGSSGCLGCCDEAEHGSRGPGCAVLCNRSELSAGDVHASGLEQNAITGATALAEASRSPAFARLRSWSRSEALVSKKSCIRLAGNPLEEASSWSLAASALKFAVLGGQHPCPGAIG